MSDKTCADCGFFIQHYLKEYGKFTRINCGHCIQARGKVRKPLAKACSHFQEPTSVE